MVVSIVPYSFTHQNRFNDPKTGHKLNFSHQFVPKTNTESTINLHPSD